MLVCIESLWFYVVAVLLILMNYSFKCLLYMCWWYVGELPSYMYMHVNITVRVHFDWLDCGCGTTELVYSSVSSCILSRLHLLCSSAEEGTGTGSVWEFKINRLLDVPLYTGRQHPGLVMFLSRNAFAATLGLMPKSPSWYIVYRLSCLYNICYLTTVKLVIYDNPS